MMQVGEIKPTGGADEPDILEGLLHYELFSAAERVRWRMEDIPWSTIDRGMLTPQLMVLVRQVALAELTTYAATRRFLQEFSDDIDFTQWMSVWFYEETKHPHALMRWMHENGETFSAGEMVRGRITAPFMKSRFGMLVTNVISEVHACAGYVGLHQAVDEPVLKRIAKHLAGDEARHATGFFAYARRAFDRSKKREEDQLEALKVLHMWLNANSRVQHPVNTVALRTSDQQELLDARYLQVNDATILEQHSILQERLTRQRALGLVSNLTGIEVKSPEDVMGHIRDLTSTVRQLSRN
jgi:rubrerythrin